MIDHNKIVEALRTVKDPKSGQDLVSMKKVEDLRVEGNQVSFAILIPPADQHIKQALNFACIAAINDIYPEAQVHVHLKTVEGESAKSGTLSQVKNIIAVASGKGGVGKSTVSVNLAISLAQQGARVGLVDADLYGPSIPTMFGLQGKRPKVQQVYGQHKLQPLQRYGVQMISIGFIIEPEQAIVLRGPRLGGIIKQFVNDVLWPELDYLIFDLPPGTGDIQLTLVQTVPITGAIIVTTPQEVAVADAIKAMNMFLLDNVNVPVLGVVENMSWFTPEELPGSKYKIFGEGGGKRLAKLSNSMLLGQVPLVMSVREGGDSGVPVAAQDGHPLNDTWKDIALKTVRQVHIRNELRPPTETVKVTT